MLSYKLGRSVPGDGEKETCVGDASAKKLPRREYPPTPVYPEAESSLDRISVAYQPIFVNRAGMVRRMM
jgi:hypothetical protein